ncbi:MAG: hypothetical protein COC08_06455 [Maribacter sp.]|nr:MAG: hypothetical protein COC08_06455 [Maribacter sp.]
MTDNQSIKPPLWFWIVSVFAFLWNLMGVGAYLGQAFMSIENLEKMTQAERLLYESQPAWVTGAFAIAVWAGALGCLALLLRKKWARPLLLVSLIGIIGQMTYMFLMSNTLEVLGSNAMVMPIMIIVVGILLLLFARSSINRHWLS